MISFKLKVAAVIIGFVGCIGFLLWLIDTVGL
jgi:preprotein translocase subunit Sss1